MILDIDPKVDYAFKRVYGREENRDVLESILEAVLAGTEFATITDLKIVNPFNERETIDDKLSIVDVRARQKSGELFNVEMQLLRFKAMQPRLLYYWSVSYADQLDKGSSYVELKPSIMICFADYDVFPGRTGWHSRFRVLDGEGRLFCPHLEIHVLELPKFELNSSTVVTPLEQWLFFLREATNIDPEHRPPCLTLPTIHKAIEELNMISLNEADHEIYRSRRKRWLDDQSSRLDASAEAKAEGKAEGKSEGKAEGKAEGRAEGIIFGEIRLLESLLGQEPTPIGQLEALPLDELVQMETELKAKLANRS